MSVEFEQHKIRFSAVQADTKQKYSVELELFDAIKPEVRIRGRCILNGL